MQRWQLMLTGLMLFLLTGAASAEWLTVTGSGVISDGNVAAARNAAQEDARQKAAALVAARASGRDHLHLGQLTESAPGRGTVREMVIRNERLGATTLEVVYEVDVGNHCVLSVSGDYRKLVGILGFVLQNPSEAGIGGLYDIESALPATLTQLLIHSPQVLPRAANQLKLYHNILNAPTRETQQRALTNALAGARELGVQFVVSGIIRNVAMYNEQALNSSLLGRSARLLNLIEVRRGFVVDMFIHDGFSGTIIFEQRYSASGLWEAERIENAGFMSPAFRQSDYGQQVGRQLQLMAGDIQRVVSCQPFMTRITRVEDKLIQFASGTNSGIRPGDKFQLYRSRELYSGTQFQGTQLTAVEQVLQVSLVQPEFAVGTLAIDPTRINIQQDDVLVRW